MAHDFRIAVTCRDRTGLLAAITARLFELGGNVGDTSFAVLGEAAELTCVCELPDEVDDAEICNALRELAEMDGAEVTVSAFEMAPTHAPSGRVTHRIEVRGPDAPGIIARLAEGFAEFGANIVRMDCERITGTGGAQYASRFEISVDEARAPACLAAAVNMNLSASPAQPRRFDGNCGANVAMR